MTQLTSPSHFFAALTLLFGLFLTSAAKADSIGGINIVANVGNVVVENQGNADIAIASVRGRNLNGKDISSFVNVGDVRVGNSGDLQLYIGSVIDPYGNGPSHVSTSVSAPSIYVQNSSNLKLNLGSVVSE